jgi:diguanylate cyclase (GGDEF)-like protein
MTPSSGMNFASFGPFVMQVSFCPVIAIVEDRQKDLGKDAVSYGAADWLASNMLSPEYVERSVGYCQQLFQLKEALRGMSLLDPLTGCYNKTGFHAVTWPQIQMASRTKKNFLVFSIDIKGLDDIEASLGNHERQNALICASRVLAKAFRRSDVLARIDPEAFAAFAGEASVANAGVIQNRIRNDYKQMRESERWPFSFELIVGYTQPDVSQEFQLEPLMGRARAMAS